MDSQSVRLVVDPLWLYLFLDGHSGCVFDKISSPLKGSSRVRLKVVFYVERHIKQFCDCGRLELKWAVNSGDKSLTGD